MASSTLFTSSVLRRFASAASSRRDAAEGIGRTRAKPATGAVCPGVSCHHRPVCLSYASSHDLMSSAENDIWEFYPSSRTLRWKKSGGDTEGTVKGHECQGNQKSQGMGSLGYFSISFVFSVSSVARS